MKEDLEKKTNNQQDKEVLKLKHTNMEPQKQSITFEPPQIGQLYKRSAEDTKKQLFVIQLNGLIFLGDPDKITRILFKKHSDYLCLSKVSYNQIRNLIIKLLEYLQGQLMAYEEEEENDMLDQDGDQEMTPVSPFLPIKIINQIYLARVFSSYKSRIYKTYTRRATTIGIIRQLKW